MAIPIEKLTNLEHIIVHKNCGDGTASALLLKLLFPYADVTFVQYNTKEHETLPVRDGTIFADFSPHEKQVKDFVRAESIVLDHHKTQKDIVAEFGELGVFGDEKKEPGVSGAVLVFREVFKRCFREDDPETLEYLRRFTTLVGIRDTWQNQHPEWIKANEQNAALAFWPFEELLSLPPLKWWQKLKLGPLLYQKKLDQAKQYADNSWRFSTPKGTRVATFEGVRLVSDAAEYLGGKVDLVFAFDILVSDGKPSMICSTRSHATFDCGKFCKFYGGGGHTSAAGFRRVLKPDDPNPFRLIEWLVEDYEDPSRPSRTSQQPL